MSNASLKTPIDPKLYRTVSQGLVKWSGDQSEALKTGGQSSWYRQPDWICSPGNWDALESSLFLNEVETGLMKAMTDSGNPGVTGDMVLGCSQLYCAQALKRSLRVRYSLNRIQRTPHQAGRLEGHSKFSMWPDTVLGYWYGAIKNSSVRS